MKNRRINYYPTKNLKYKLDILISFTEVFGKLLGYSEKEFT